MEFNEAIGSGFRRYTDFRGRSSRSEYWWWTLIITIASIIFSILDRLMGGTQVLYSLFVLAVFLPTLAVSARRLHDIDRSGWRVLISFIPIVGTIILIVWYVTPGNDGDNQFGANPLHGSSAVS